MSWQDLVFGIGSILFIFALIPTLKGTKKPDPTTSAITATVLFMFSCTYWTLELYFASVTSYITAILWLLILTQTVGKRYGEKW